MAAQEFWVDPSVAPGGAGTSSSDPYDRLDLALTAATGAEAYIYVKRGLIYAPYSTNPAVLNISSKNPAGFLRIKSYGDAVMPPTMFAGTYMPPGDTGWSYVGAGLWKKAISDNSQSLTAGSMRIFVGSHPTGPAAGSSLGTGYTYGTAIARYAALFDNATEAQVLAQVGTRGLTHDRLWMYTSGALGGNGILYIYTGNATQDPPTFYGGITMVGANSLYDASGVGRRYGALTSQCSNVHMKEIDTIFAHSAGLRMSSSSSTSADILFSDCNAYAYGSNGLCIGNATSVSYKITRGVMRNCVSDAVATTAEDYNYPTKASGVTQTNDWLQTSQDGSVIGSYTESCMFDRCTTIDAFHVNTYIGTSIAARQDTVNAMVVDCVGRQPNRGYGTLLNISGLNAGNVAVVTRFAGSDAVSGISRTGSGTAVFNSCVIKDLKRPNPAYDFSAGSGPGTGTGVNQIPGLSIYPNAPFGSLETGCITLNNCTVMQPYGFMLWVSELSEPAAVPAGVFVANNSLFVDTRWINDSSARTFNGGGAGKAGVSWEVRDCPTAGAVVMTGCYYYTGSAGGLRVGNTTSGTPVAFSAWAGLSGTMNESDPMVDENGFMTSASSPLYHSGTHTTYKRDAKGMQFNNPPSIGAYEYVGARPSRLT